MYFKYEQTEFLKMVDESGAVVGIVDENDIMLEVVEDEARFQEPVRDAMSSKLETVQADQPLAALPPILDRGMVAIVFDGDQFVGLITRIDLLNYLRRRMR